MRRVIIFCALVGLALATHDLAAQYITPLPTPEMPATSPTPSQPPIPKGFVRVVSVIDGDTIEIEGGMRVRYLGIDTPETVHPTKPVQCFGPEASAENHRLVEGSFVRLERDTEDTDHYGRLLRYIYLPDGTFVNEALVRNGYASVLLYPPNIAHARELQAAESAARATGAGLWSACTK